MNFTLFLVQKSERKIKTIEILNKLSELDKNMG